jgi:peptidyl-prolyl cis-trans isomerase C
MVLRDAARSRILPNLFLANGFNKLSLALDTLHRYVQTAFVWGFARDEDMKTRGAVAVAWAFMLFAVLGGQRSHIPRPIEVTQDVLRPRDLAWAAKSRYQPASEEVRDLLNDGIRASKLRLAPNMEFVSDEASGVQYPGADELQARFKKSALRFEEAPRISFRQLCFSFSRDGERAHDLASRAFRKVSGQPMDSDAGTANLADHLTLQSYYGDRTPGQVAKVFGAAFARSLFRLRPGAWQGPIKSVSGWHVVWIDSIATGPEPSLAERLTR